MLGGILPRLIPPLLLVAISLVASPGQAQTFGSTVNVSNTKSNSTTTDMAVSGSNVYVVWVDDKGTYQPLFSRSTNSGLTFSTGVQVFSGTSTMAPHVAAAGDNVYIARSARPSPKSPSQVYLRRSTNGGGTFGSQIQVSAASVDGAFFDAIAISGDNVYIVWRQWVGNWDVFYARSINSGLTFEPPVNLSNTSASIFEGVKVVADGSSVHVAWSERVSSTITTDIFYKVSVDGGASFGNLVNISNSPTTASVFTALAVSGSSVYVAYKDDPGIMLSCSLAGGGFSSPTSLSGTRYDTRGVGGGPQIAATGTDVHVIWHANPPPTGNYDIFYVRSDNVCSNLSAVSNISNSVPADATGVLSANGSDVYVSWSRGLPAGDIYMAHSANNGAIFAPAVNLSMTPGDSRGVITIATSTEIHAAWLDNTPGNSEVFYRRGTIP